MDTLGPALILLPVVSQLADPFERVPVLDVIEVEVLNHVSSVHVDYYQSVESDRLILGELPSHELDCSIELEGESLVIFLELLLSEALFDLFRPVDLASVEDALPRVD